ncbi:MAG: DUF6639 family protein [Motiliproteus sp.]
MGWIGGATVLTYRFIALLIIWPTQSALAISCPDSDVELTGEPPSAQVAQICTAVTAALAFLEPLGLDQRRLIRIDVVERPLMEKQQPLYGSYDATQDLVRVMSYTAIERQSLNPRIYDQPFDRWQYTGVVAHEVAHAIVAQHAPGLNRTAQEYLAHATQLAVQPIERRSIIIERADVDPWQLDDVISDIYMAMALTQFAVKCYQHLSTHPQPQELVQMLLNSKWKYVVVTR